MAFTTQKAFTTPFTLFLFSLPFPVCHLRSCLPTPADGAFHILGQLAYFNQRDKERHSEKAAKSDVTIKASENGEIVFCDLLATIHERHDHIPPKPTVILQLHRDLYKFSVYLEWGKTGRCQYGTF